MTDQTGPSESRRDREPVEVLLAEDDPSHVASARWAFEEGKVVNDRQAVSDGDEAMRFLRRAGGYADAPQSDVVLMDPEMSRKGGTEALADVDDDPSLSRIQVVVLTSSVAEQDVAESSEHTANASPTEPVGYQTVHDVVRQVESFRFEAVGLHTVG